jgi:signal transduction histidine kinase
VRARLTTAILLLVAGTLLLTGIGSLVLIRRTTYNSAEEQLYTEARVVASIAAAQKHPGSSRGILSLTNTIKLVGDYRSIGVATMTPDGTLLGGLPESLQSVELQTRPLQRNRSVAGAVNGIVYVLIPLELTTAQKQSLRPPVPAEDEAVLVATRTVPQPTTRLGYFVLVSLAALAVATGVAYWLASRFSRPLREAVAVTEKIAGGDLESRVPATHGRETELAALAASINAMADSLERARQQQRQFLLSVSHDLRTPLTSIRGYADAIAEGATADVPRAVAVIRAEADRLERLVGDLLDLARLDARRFSFSPHTVDVAEVVRGSVESFRHEAATAGLTIRALLPDATSPMVQADPDRLAQILGNLIENAARYAASRVDVGARTEGGRVVLWVVDDGPGIPPGDLPRVFEPHFSADTTSPTDNRTRVGTGLGLAIVAELASAMGAAAQAESPVTPQGGTRLSVWFAAAPSPAPTPARAPSPHG